MPSPYETAIAEALYLRTFEFSDRDVARAVGCLLLRDRWWLQVQEFVRAAPTKVLLGYDRTWPLTYRYLAHQELKVRHDRPRNR